MKGSGARGPGAEGSGADDQYARVLSFFSQMQNDLHRYGRASRRWVGLSESGAVASLGPRPRRQPLVREIALRAEMTFDGGSWTREEDTATVRLDAPALEELVEATRLQVEPNSPAFHGSFTSWGFAYAIDWHGAE